jgi:hypothetical protein
LLLIREPVLVCMFGRDYIFKHRQTFMRASTAHAQDLLPDFLTRTPSLHDFLETGGGSVTDFGGELGKRPEALDISGSPEQIRESMAGTRCSTTNYAVITYFCGASAAANRLAETRVPLSISSMEVWLDRFHAVGIYPRAVFDFGIQTGEADIDHVW